MTAPTDNTDELKALKKEKERKERQARQLQDVIDGVGFSSDITLARYYDTTRKTLWSWARDEANKFPQPKKISANMTRWSNAQIKAHRANQLMGQLYGQ